jgi:hypothetical protein
MTTSTIRTLEHEEAGGFLRIHRSGIDGRAEPGHNGEWLELIDRGNMHDVAAWRLFDGDEPIWHVDVVAARFAREEPLESTLFLCVHYALSTLPGVHSVEHLARETWCVTGSVDGEDLIRAVGEIVDPLVPEIESAATLRAS